ncbi:MAG: transketolase family protein [Promethearchaeota archaeon]
MTEASLRDSFGELLIEHGKINERIVVLDADLSSSTRTYKFAREFPERFFNMGISEQNMAGVAMGLAISGKIPIISGFSIFTTGRAWEFIRMIAHDNLNVKIITTHGGFVGEDGSTHNALEDFSLMSVLPNMQVLVPSDVIELEKMFSFAIENNGPFYLRLPRGAFPILHDDGYKFNIGSPDVLKNGTDVCLIGVGYGSSLALNAAELIEKELKCSVKVINQSTIKPINETNLLNEIASVKGVIIIEEHQDYCGVGSIIAKIIVENILKPIKFVGVKNSFGQSGTRKENLNAHGLTVEGIVKLAKQLLS